jgi:hypothetical protein
MSNDATRRAPIPPAPRGGISFAGLLAIVFIALKLGGVIGWSWWWVLSPLWIGYAIALLIVAICLLWAVLS